MLELVALVCAAALIVWTPIEARKVAGGWVRKRHKGTPEEFRAQYRRQLGLFVWLGIGIGVVNMALGVWLETEAARATIRLATGGLWLGVAASALFGRSILDKAAR
ncbi:hypothetical protein [Roseomonas sp. HF4]|uniref:hypothetical protein n=1 Tax=Roseomonas sp. HF4 TaxID=2562313 RepID=UPI0010C12AC6|nr:hypothetical protein [Roseomonas sp. HF4]